MILFKKHLFLLLFTGISFLAGGELPNSNQFHWQPVHSRFAEARILECSACTEKGVAVALNFPQGSGYAGIRTDWPLNLEENFQFSFYLRSDLPANNLEFKLLDDSGENVWWQIFRNFEFSEDWQRIVIKKSRIEFAWGPARDRRLRKMAQLEIIVSSVNGGKGTVYIDRIEFQPLPEPPKEIPALKITAGNKIMAPVKADILSDSLRESYWESRGRKNQSLLLDFGYWKENGALELLWDETLYPTKYQIFTSQDGQTWQLAKQINEAPPGRHLHKIAGNDGRYLKIETQEHASRKGLRLYELKAHDFQSVPDDFAFWKLLAKAYPKGFFPRYFYNQQTYWTITGAPDDDLEILIGEDGQIELDRRALTLEPFIHNGRQLLTWQDSENRQSLADNYLPFPQVKRRYNNFELTIEPFVWKANGKTISIARYHLQNTGKSKAEGKFFLAMRPFQVNSPWQFLNNPGGLASVSELSINANLAAIDEKIFIYPLQKASDWAATTFESGEIVTWLQKNRLPKSNKVKDPARMASGVWEYPYSLEPLEKITFSFVINYDQDMEKPDKKAIANIYEEAENWWRQKLNKVSVTLPGNASRLVEIVKANLAYILINRDGKGIQPGSRSYERSWIRDGSLTSSALLKFGIQQEVRQFIEWYAGFQAEDGYVPCVVDKRGPDPVPEHDSHGQLIYAIAEYVRFTGDTAFLKQHWKNVTLAVRQLEKLSASQRTETYRTGSPIEQASFGLLPESISHEGYSAKPMHSYWDNFFALRGYKDAIWLAKYLGKTDSVNSYIEYEKRFAQNLYASIDKAVKLHGIDYLPGCVELGDFDPTSTAIAILPGGEMSRLPHVLLSQTFNRYYEYFQKRRDQQINWKDYTPYELRILGAMIALGRESQVLDLLDFFLKDQRPDGWRHWAEVVRNGYRSPGFIGDMPHTWVGSDFINSLRSMLVMEDEISHTLILGAGIAEKWALHPEGVKVKNLPTYYGNVTYSIQDKGDYLEAKLWRLENFPEGGILFKNFLPDAPLSVYNSEMQILETIRKDGFVLLSQDAATLRWEKIR